MAVSDIKNRNPDSRESKRRRKDRELAEEPQGQYWAGRTPPPNNPPPNMAATNFVVITNGEGCALNGTAVAAVLINQ